MRVDGWSPKLFAELIGDRGFDILTYRKGHIPPVDTTAFRQRDGDVAAMESLDDPDDRAAGLLALRTVAEACGGLGAVAAEAGMSREALYRALSAKGNPTLKTILAVLEAVGMRLSVEPGQRAAA